MNNTNLNGFSLVEVLFATLLFSIIILGFVQYKETIIWQHQQFYRLLQAERIAFQLLDSYPHVASHIIPDSWQYQVTHANYTEQCQWVFASVILPNQEQIKQKRLICD